MFNILFVCLCHCLHSLGDVQVIQSFSRYGGKNNCLPLNENEDDNNNIGDDNNVEIFRNKPAAQATGADPPKAAPSIGKNAVTFEQILQFGCPLTFRMS